ncbi:MAG: iron-sulfur cluster assembly protein, partial [Dehalococcoidia bacterium]|nr:iron-sulfur cluster assembly protein [Dehalococcoidia bacterium]
MTSIDQIRDRLDEVIVPHVVRSLTSMNLIRDITIKNGTVKVTLASTALDEYSQQWISEKIKESMAGLPDIKDIEINYVDAKPTELNKIKHVIAVMSGKGGVGKSLVSGLIAVAL